MQIQLLSDSFGDVSPEFSSLDRSLQKLPSNVRSQISERSRDLSFSALMVSPQAIQSPTDGQALTASALPSTLTAPIRFPFRPIIGTPQPDFLIGTESSDFIYGLASDDLILALGGNDYIFGGSGNDIAFGDRGNDTFFQGRPGSRFVDGTGNDFLIGGEGKDTVDYSQLGQGITLKAQGVIDKGKAGTDQIQSIERIIGANGQTNTIDGRVPGGGPVSFDISLVENRLTTQGIPGLGDVEFTVQNFSQVFGTGNDDTVLGDNQRNRLFGEGGDDRLSGLGGDDVVQGGSGNDVLNGGAGRDKLSGGSGNDNLQGGFDNDVLNGTASGRGAGRNERDTLTGGFAFVFAKSEDTLTAALQESSRSGFRDFAQLDILPKSEILGTASRSLETGSRRPPTFLDRDTFVLGDSRNAFYLGDDTLFGLNDYARITDFQSGVDTIQLNGSLDDYFFLGSSLIFKNNGSGQLDPKDDLVGVVQGTGFNLAGTDFRFVG